MIQRETISIEYGKVLSKDYNSIKMTIKETYRVSGEVDFNRKDFVNMKCQEFEDIIDTKLQPAETVTEKYPQTAPAKAKDESEFRLDNRQQKKFKCPDCGKLDRLEKYKLCYNCNQKSP